MSLEAQDSKNKESAISPIESLVTKFAAKKAALANDEPARLNLALSRELANVVEELAMSTDTTKTAVIRQAIALMRLAHEEKKKGRHLGFVSDSSRLDTEIVGAF